MSWIIILILIALGIVFILLELLVIPGTTFVGIVGVIALALGVYETYDLYGTFWGNIALVSTSLFSVAMLVLALRSNTWKRAELSTSIDSRIDQVNNKFAVGDEGKTISRLTPMGKAIFNDEFAEVSTYGNFIDPGVAVRIIEIKQNKIIVEEIIHE